MEPGCMLWALHTRRRRWRTVAVRETSRLVMSVGVRLFTSDMSAGALLLLLLPPLLPPLLLLCPPKSRERENMREVEVWWCMTLRVSWWISGTRAPSDLR